MKKRRKNQRKSGQNVPTGAAPVIDQQNLVQTSRWMKWSEVFKNIMAGCWYLARVIFLFEGVNPLSVLKHLSNYFNIF